MYKLIAFLLVLIAALQYRLWLGDGGIREYREITRRIEELKQEGERRVIRNAAVAADVEDLKDGEEAIEERARHELGLIKPGETFVQIYDEVEQSPPSPVPSVDVSVAQPAQPAPARSSSRPQPKKSSKKTGTTAEPVPTPH